jgi:hypothetical protein
MATGIAPQVADVADRAIEMILSWGREPTTFDPSWRRCLRSIERLEATT